MDSTTDFTTEWALPPDDTLDKTIEDFLDHLRQTRQDFKDSFLTKYYNAGINEI